MKPPSSLTTVGDWIRWATNRFEEASLYYGHGTDNAWDDATQLVLHSLQRPPQLLDVPLLETPLTKTERTRIHNRIQCRISERIPTAYLTHKAVFAGLDFYVDERVLIPRSPFAELIEQRFAPWVSPNTVRYIADVGTGSGCMAIACAMAFPQAQIVALDNSKDALAVAKRNVKHHQVTDRVTLVQSDLLTQAPPHAYDLIISNPPYVETAEMQDLPPEYRHEPAHALESGEDGLREIRCLIPQAGKLLSPDGLLIAEVGGGQDALQQAFPDLPFIWLELTRGGDGVFLLTAEHIKL